MSTNAAVRSAWSTNVFDPLSVTYYDYLFDYESDQQVPTLGYTSGVLNHYQFSVSSVEIPMMTQQNDLIFTVRVIRIMEDDPGGDNQKTIIDDFRTVIDKVNDSLGTSWAGTVDLPVDFPTTINPERIDWGSTSAWRGEAVFTALKQVDSAAP